METKPQPTGVAILQFLLSSGLYRQAERDNRRHDRVAKREAKHAEYAKAGLNGTAARVRRARQRDRRLDDLLMVRSATA